MPLPPTLEAAGIASGAAATAVARRLQRGPARPSWSLRTELVAATMRAVVLRSKRRGIPWLRAVQSALPERVALVDRVEFTWTRTGGVASLVCTPRSGAADDGQPRPTLLHLHGGGYVIGSPEGFKDTLARLAVGVGARVVSLDYRLAPEYRFPAAHEDAEAAARAILAETPAERVALVGDSAGGALAVATLCALRDAGAPLPAAAALLCPWTAPLAEGGSMETNADVDFGDRELLVGWIREAAGEADPRDPRLCVLDAPLAGLPPLLVQAGGAEILLDSIREFAARAEAAGVNVELRVWDDLFHDFQMQAALLPEAAGAMEEVTTFLRKRIAP